MRNEPPPAAIPDRDAVTPEPTVATPPFLVLASEGDLARTDELCLATELNERLEYPA